MTKGDLHIMKTNIIPSMKDTLFNPVSSNMGDSLVEIAELGLDSVIQDCMLKDIPVLSIIASLCKTGVNLCERNLIRQTAIFISSFNAGTIPPDKLASYRNELESNPKKAEKKLGRVILLLDRILERHQAKVLGHFYSSYIKGSLSWDKFVEVSEVNLRMFMSDYAELGTVFQTPVKQADEVSNRRMYRIQRLESLGLVMENRYRMHSGTILTYLDTDDRFVTTPLGSTFASLM